MQLQEKIQALRQQLKLQALFGTRFEKGIILFEKMVPFLYLPKRAKWLM